MKLLLRLCSLLGLALFVWLPVSSAQTSLKVSRIDIKHVGPPAVSDELVRANIRTKVGDTYVRATVDEDVRNLYATGYFYNLQVTDQITDQGVVLTYIVQGKPRLSDIKFKGNKKYGDAKLRKKLTSKTGEPLDEHKLFNDAQEIKKTYEKSGYPRTEVKYVLNIDENAGTGTATFEVKESPKIKIKRVEFVGAQAFSQRKLRKAVKTRKHWMFSWITSHGTLKEDQLQEDREKLAEFYREKGYIDFELRDVQIENLSERSIAVHFVIFEGKPYKVGAITIKGATLLPTNAISPGFKSEAKPPPSTDRRTWYDSREMHRVFVMKVGSTFTPKGLAKDVEAIENFYGAKGYIDVTQSSGNLRVRRIPNVETGTMDLEFQIDEGQKSYIEKIEIRGNTKTKDKVIRRELAVSPGETFNMVGVKLSKTRLEQLQYFEKVDTHVEPSDAGANRKNLIVGVEEKNTGNLSLGAGFSSVDSIVGFVEVSQANFDLFHPPTFTGGGQKFRVRVQLGTQRQDYEVSFVEPWLFGKKLRLDVDLYYRDLSFESLHNVFDETRAGAKLGLTRALGSDFLIGGINYTIEDVGINLDPSLHGPLLVRQVLPDGGVAFTPLPATAPKAILDEKGHSLVSKVGVSLAYDTSNSALLPNAGQRTELSAQVAGGPFGGEQNFYKLELKSAWYFKGLFPGHVLEVVGEAGVTDAFDGSDTVPFYERWYLGGLYSLRGFKYRSVSPREPGLDEPVGGNTFWFGSAEYSIPIIERLRFAVFYDIGNVSADTYDFSTKNFNDNWGFGLRLNLPIGPLRLDYGIPIHHDEFNGGTGKFQFGVGYRRQF